MISRIQWENPQWVWLSLLLLTAALSALVWLYRPQVRPLRAPIWWLLLGLRALALIVLALAILRPTLLREVDRERRGTLAILIDQSRSMNVVDPRREPAYLVQVAAALGSIPSDLRPAELVQLRLGLSELRSAIDQVYRATSEVEYARLSGRGAESAEAHLRQSRTAAARLLARLKSIAASSPHIESLAADIESIAFSQSNGQAESESLVAAQIDAVAARVDSIQDELDARLYASDAQVRGVCDEIATLPRIELVRRALHGDSGLLSRLGGSGDIRVFGFSQDTTLLDQPAQALDADGIRTDLDTALRDVRRAMVGQHLAGVILFSDGRQAGGDPASGRPISDVPIFAVAAAPSGDVATADVSIERVVLPSSAFVGETVTARVDLLTPGISGTTEVWLDCAGQRSRRQILLTGPRTRVELPVRFNTPGPSRVTISVTPLAGEATAENNHVERIVRVSSERIRVGLLGSAGTWDDQFLRRALRGSPAFEVSEHAAGANHYALPADQILMHDVLVLSNLPAGSLDFQQWDALSRLVHEQGGGIVLLAGDPSILWEYAKHPLAAALLPWSGGGQPAWRVWSGEEPVFRIEPAGNGAADPLEIFDDPDASSARWGELAPVFRFLSTPPLRPEARSILIERDSMLSVLTETRIGAGRSLLLGLNEIWRWRSFGDDRRRDRFWQQLIRKVAQEPYAVSDGVLALDAERLRGEPMQPLEIRARVNLAAIDDDLPPIETPVLQILRDGQLVGSEVPELAESGIANRFETTLVDLAEGDYEIRLIYDDESISLPLSIAPNDEIEMRNVSPDLQNLRRIAGVNGQVLGLEDLASLPQSLAGGASESAIIELRLWNSPYLFILVLACLGAEWAIRKRVGLA